MSDEWIAAHEAYARVQVHYPYRATEAICERAHDGLIAARAERLIVGDEVVEPAIIPQGFWWARGQAALAAKWPSGDFETWIDGHIHCRAYGVIFARIDIERMLPAQATAPGFARALPGNYASATLCRSEVAATLNCTVREAERMILRRARTGLLASRCSRIWWRTRDRYGASDQEDTNVAVPDWFWEECLDDPDVVLDWISGEFVGRGIVDDDECKVRVSGVEFEIAGIVALEVFEREQSGQDGNAKEHAASESDPPATVANPTRKLNELWLPWVAELVAYVHEDGIPPGVGSQGQQKIIKDVDDRLAKAGLPTLGRTTVQPVVQAVLDRIRAADD